VVFGSSSVSVIAAKAMPLPLLKTQARPTAHQVRDGTLLGNGRGQRDGFAHAGRDEGGAPCGTDLTLVEVRFA
jgi:hypothetical protein